MNLLVTLLFAVGLGLIFGYGYRRATTDAGGIAEQRLRQRIAEESGPDPVVASASKRKPKSLSVQIVDSFTRAFQRSESLASAEGTNLVAWLDEQLILAGVRDKLNPYRALGTATAIWTAAALFAVFTLATGALPSWAAIFGAVIVASYPPLKLRQLKTRRRDLIEQELPFFVQELAMTVSAGAENLDNALMRVAANNARDEKAPLAREFDLAVKEYRVGGRVREEALLDVYRRTQLPAVDTLVDALIAAFDLGGKALEETLQRQSDQARELWAQSMRSFAARKEPMITLGMIETTAGGLLMLAAPLVISALGAFF
jgi:Flp pilus assembly protein TadB